MLKPIVVLNKNEVVKHIYFEFDIEKFVEDLIIEIKDAKGNVLFDQPVSNISIIKIGQQVGKIDIYYKNNKGLVLYVQHEDLYKKVLNLKEDETTAVDKKETILIEELKLEVINSIDNIGSSQTEKDYHTMMLKETTSKDEARSYVTEKIRQCVDASKKTKGLSTEKINQLSYTIYADLYGMGVLQELDDNPEIQEILVNVTDFPSFDSKIYYYLEGKKYVYKKRNFKNLTEVMKVFKRSIEFVNEELNNAEKSKIEAVRANKDRVTITIPHTSENYSLNIRKFSSFIPNPQMMKKVGTVDEWLESLFRVLVAGKANIGIGGAMATGKTTFINYLLTYTDPIERKVVIASVSETDTQRVLKGHDVVVFNVNEERGNTFAELIKTSLRTTASRVIIPESRGGEFKQVHEANIKTQGNMFTAHALEDTTFLNMCVDMYLESDGSGNESSQYILNKLSQSINIIIIMRKVDGKIRLKSVSEVLFEDNQFAGLNPLYHLKFNPNNPSDCWYERTENRISDRFKDYLNENGVPKKDLENF